MAVIFESDESVGHEDQVGVTDFKFAESCGLDLHDDTEFVVIDSLLLKTVCRFWIEIRRFAGISMFKRRNVDRNRLRRFIRHKRSGRTGEFGEMGKFMTRLSRSWFAT